MHLTSASSWGLYFLHYILASAAVLCTTVWAVLLWIICCKICSSSLPTHYLHLPSHHGALLVLLLLFLSKKVKRKKWRQEILTKHLWLTTFYSLVKNNSASNSSCLCAAISSIPSDRGQPEPTPGRCWTAAPLLLLLTFTTMTLLCCLHLHLSLTS